MEMEVDKTGTFTPFGGEEKRKSVERGEESYESYPFLVWKCNVSIIRFSSNNKSHKLKSSGHIQNHHRVSDQEIIGYDQQ